MAEARRNGLQIQFELLRSIQLAIKAGEMSLYRIERLSGLTYQRLDKHMKNLRSLGLLDGSEGVTERGREFLEAMSRSVIPVLRTYGLWHETLSSKLAGVFDNSS